MISRARQEARLGTRARWLEEEIEIKLRTHKTQAVEVEIREPLYRWSNWRLVKNSHEFQKDTAQLIHFTVSVPRDGETAVRYRVRYTW